MASKIHPSLCGVLVRPMRIGDIWKAGSTSDAAFENDPMALYISDNKKRTPAEKRLSRMSKTTLYALWYKNKTIFTVRGGLALVMVTLARKRPKRTIPMIKDIIANFILFMGNMAASAVIKKRSQEVKEKVSKVIGEKLGDRVKSMIYVELLATNPSHQGRGYGSALLEQITNIADHEVQAAWLVSSNIANTAFYNSHGFETIATILLGDDNPDWRAGPVVVSLMVREPMEKQFLSEKHSFWSHNCHE